MLYTSTDIRIFSQEVWYREYVTSLITMRDPQEGQSVGGAMVFYRDNIHVTT